jgi:hypothetical protein
MKKISLPQAITRLYTGKIVFYQEGKIVRKMVELSHLEILRSPQDLEVLSRRLAKSQLSLFDDKFENIVFYESNETNETNEPKQDRSRVVVRRDITFIEAMQLRQESMGTKIWYFDVDTSDWVPLVGNVNVDKLVATKFKAEFHARSIVIDMVPRVPPASKRNAFEFQNEEFNISIYGKKGTIPNSGKGIRVQITEIL